MKKHRTRKRRFSPAKYREMMIYLIAATESGKNKLRYLMYQADFSNFAHSGKSITGETYRKGSEGIVGDHFEETLLKLKKKGIIESKKVEILQIIRTTQRGE